MASQAQAAPLAVVPQTADADLLARPLRTLADVRAIEETPLDERLTVVDFYQRIALALAARDPNDTAVHFVPQGDLDGPIETVSFGELRRKIELTARLLQSHGIGRGDVVAILLPTLPAAYWSIIGAMSLAIPFPINWMLESDHLADLVAESKAKAVIALGPTPGFRIWESLQEVRDRLPKDLLIWSTPGPGGERLADSDLDAALEREGQAWPLKPVAPASGQDAGAYIHSGGTTGKPKIVRLSHRNMSYRHWQSQLAQQVGMGEVMPHDTPIFHVGGLAGRFLPMLACGVSFVIPSVMGAREKSYMTNYWKFVERFGLTRLSGVPTMFAALTKTPPQGEDLSTLKPFFQTGSTALPIAVRREFERISGCRILNSYGLTENTATVAVELHGGEPVEGSSGIPAPYTRVRVAVPDSPEAEPRLCEPGQTGMLQVMGPGVTLGYLSETQTRASRTPDGWLITGDLGRIDEEGNLFVTGRAKDVIIRGGHNIDPGPIEEALLQCPEVLHAAAVGKPDAYAGELPIAYVQLRPGMSITAAELIERAAPRISERAAIPKEIFVMDSLPLSAVGKPLKVELRQDAAERVFRAVLAQLPAFSGKPGVLDVTVEPHPVHGSLVRIALRDPADLASPEVKQQIQTLMEQYAFVYELEAG
jgi:fatty-acyl-CoA synthase